MKYLVCYDIADDKRRRRLAVILEGYGDRIQYSIFEAVLTESLYARMMEDIEEIIDPDEDRVSIVGLCTSCDARRVHLGLAELVERPGEEIVFIV